MRISFSNISYSYKGADQKALKNISFEMDSSEPLAIIGKNGSGKTTLIKILIQQNVNFEGSYLIDNNDQRGFTGDLLAKYSWGYLPEELSLDGRLTGFEMSSIIAELRGLKQDAFEQDILYLKERLRIESWFENKQCSDYSAGMRRKVGLLIAFLGDRRLVVLDEPTNFLDALTVLELKKLIREKILTGVGIVVSSHIVDFTSSIVDRVMVLNEGTLHFDGKLSDLRKQAKDKSIDDIFFGLLTGTAENKQ